MLANAYILSKRDTDFNIIRNHLAENDERYLTAKSLYRDGKTSQIPQLLIPCNEQAQPDHTPPHIAGLFMTALPEEFPLHTIYTDKERSYFECCRLIWEEDTTGLLAERTPAALVRKMIEQPQYANDKPTRNSEQSYPSARTAFPAL